MNFLKYAAKRVSIFDKKFYDPNLLNERILTTLALFCLVLSACCFVLFVLLDSQANMLISAVFVLFYTFFVFVDKSADLNFFRSLFIISAYSQGFLFINALGGHRCCEAMFFPALLLPFITFGEFKRLLPILYSAVVVYALITWPYQSQYFEPLRINVTGEVPTSLALFVVLFSFLFTALPILYIQYVRNQSDVEFGRYISQRFRNSNILALGSMAYGIVRLIETPLANIERATKIIKKSRDEDAGLRHRRKDREEIKVINDDVTNVLNLLASLKYFSRNAVNDSIVEVSGDELLQHCLNICKIQSSLNHSPVRIISEDMPHKNINCRPAQLIQLLVDMILQLNEFERSGKSEKIFLEILDSREGQLIFNLWTKPLTNELDTEDPNSVCHNIDLIEKVIIDNNGKFEHFHKRKRFGFSISLPFAEQVRV